MILPPPWRLGTPPVAPDALLRFRLAWVRNPEPDEQPRSVGVIMYNPALEGVLVRPIKPRTPGPHILDGRTHSRVRRMLAGYPEIRVANLCPVRTPLPSVARAVERTLAGSFGVARARAELEAAGFNDLHAATRDALTWACEAPTVVVAWGSGARSAAMDRAVEHVIALAAGRMFCWGTTVQGDPVHPSPQNLRVTLDTPLQHWTPPEVRRASHTG